MQSQKQQYILLLGSLFWFQQARLQEPATGIGKEEAPAIVATEPGDLAPAGTPFIIREIKLTGNRKTRPETILRELPFRTGDQFQLKDIVKKFEEARQLLLNTGLFHDAIVALKGFEGYQVDVMINVRERWYVFPLPHFKTVDRNLNQWIVQHDAKLSRVNYGLKLIYNNTSGRNDKLRFGATSGYTKQLSFSYDGLYIDHRMKWGINVRFSMGKNREVNYNTVNDKQVFIKDDDNYIRRFISGGIEITYRKAIRTRQYLGFGFIQEDVNDTIVSLNPDYFKTGNRLSFPEIYYRLTFFDLDYNPYPTKGFAGEFRLTKKGFNSNINLWESSVKASASWPVSKKAFLNLVGYGAIKLPFHQPYFNLRFLGYNDFYLQGYEYYVIDGVTGGYFKATLGKEFFNFHIKSRPSRGSFANGIPIRIFGKVYGNAGYVYNPQPGDNSLSNELLLSGGIGIDVITAYDFIIKLDWSFNQLGQNGLFLHNRSIF